MRVQFLGAASVLIESTYARILCDPWFVGPTYYGAWRQDPPLDHQALLKELGDITAIWISHRHPDHMHLPTLERIHAPILSMAEGVLQHRDVRVERFKVDDTDSIGVFTDDRGHCVINMNDVTREQFDNAQVELPRPNILLSSYTGAGPWPQCFWHEKGNLAEICEGREARFKNDALHVIGTVAPYQWIPIAGEYALRGSLASLNSWRGSPPRETTKHWTPCANPIPRGAWSDEASKRHAWVDLYDYTEKLDHEKLPFPDIDALARRVKAQLRPYKDWRIVFGFAGRSVSVGNGPHWHRFDVDPRQLELMLSGRQTFENVLISSSMFMIVEGPFDRGLYRHLRGICRS